MNANQRADLADAFRERLESMINPDYMRDLRARVARGQPVGSRNPPPNSSSRVSRGRSTLLLPMDIQSLEVRPIYQRGAYVAESMTARGLAEGTTKLGGQAAFPMSDLDPVEDELDIVEIMILIAVPVPGKLKEKSRGYVGFQFVWNAQKAVGPMGNQNYHDPEIGTIGLPSESWISLIELLVAIGIIGVLIALIVPALWGVRSVGEKASRLPTSARRTPSSSSTHALRRDLSVVRRHRIYSVSPPDEPGSSIRPATGISRSTGPASCEVAPWREHFTTWLGGGAQRDNPPGRTWPVPSKSPRSSTADRSWPVRSSGEGADDDPARRPAWAMCSRRVRRSCCLITALASAHRAGRGPGQSSDGSPTATQASTE